jgi:hypothetical protein
LDGGYPERTAVRKPARREHEKWIGRRTANMQHDGSTTAKWWMICRSGAGRPEAMTLTCGGGRALALFCHEEEAELFSWSLALDGFENGWRVREGSAGR